MIPKIIKKHILIYSILSICLLSVLIILIVYLVSKKKSPAPHPGPGPHPEPGPGPHPEPGPQPAPPVPQPAPSGPNWVRPGAYENEIPINKGYATITKYAARFTGGKGTFGVNGTGEGQKNKNPKVKAWNAAVPYALFNTKMKAGVGFFQWGHCINGIMASWGKVPTDTQSAQLCYRLTSIGGPVNQKLTLNVQIMETCGGNCAYKPISKRPDIIPDCPTLSGGGGLYPWGPSAPPIKSMEMPQSQYKKSQYSPKFRCKPAQMDPQHRKKINATQSNLPTTNVTSTGINDCNGLPNYLDWCGGNFMHFDVDEDSPFFQNPATGTIGLVKYERIDCTTGKIL